MKLKIYVAASFAYADRNKTEARKTAIKQVVDRIKEHLDADFYLPQELKIPGAWDYSLEDWSYLVYKHDLENLIDADLIIFISFGKENNAGAVWEVGFVAGHNAALHEAEAHEGWKQMIVIKMTDAAESLMITNSVHTIITKDEIDTYDWKRLPWIKTALNQLS